ncbi:TIGR01777 family oxidoreductase [Runella zeae]|uniref:TIGR01777 family oxidoreductase n=1 Tax=Runella zeae TaxID=94255 RepID=UPI002357D48E|nr:TIGR01777 family oxidoreductase [Runella zeae]
MSLTVLITGGTGIIGRRLTELLLAKGYKVAYLSRREVEISDVKVYKWNLDKGWIDPKALAEADYLVHLAGEGIADGRWTNHRKQTIINSRTKTIELIARELQGRPYKLKAFVSASGISFYGTDTGDRHLVEQTPSGSDFLAHVTRSWENAADLVAHVGIRTTKLRTGVVLTDKGGALPKIALPIQWGVGAPLGNGKQWVSWIHIDDLCNMYIEALENNQWRGVYNAVAPSPVTNTELTRLIAKVIQRPLWLPNIPAFVLKAIYGEMANVVLGGNYIINQRITKETDFRYQFSDLEQALENLFKK